MRLDEYLMEETTKLLGIFDELTAEADTER